MVMRKGEERNMRVGIEKRQEIYYNLGRIDSVRVVDASFSCALVTVL
jgi:hypothetical protein